MHRSSGYFAVMLVLLLVTPKTHAQTDQCSDILRGGIFETMLSDQKAVAYRYVQAMYCANSSDSSTAGESLDLGILTPKGSVDLDWNRMSAQEKRQAMCDYRLEETFTDDSLRTFANQASAAIVNAWSTCMSGKTLKFTFRLSDAGRQVRLDAENRIPGLNRLKFAGSTLDKQIKILPSDALDCGAEAFERDVQESSITCIRRAPDQQVFVKLLTTQGGRPEIVIPAIVPLPPPPQVPDDIYLSNALLKLKQGITPVFRAIQGGGQAFARGVRVHPPSGAGILIFQIPPGAQRFNTRLIWFSDEHCDTYHPRDSATVVFRAGGSAKGTYHVEQFDPRIQDVSVELADVPAGAPKELELSISSNAHGACDHVGLAEPHFTFRRRK